MPSHEFNLKSKDIILIGIIIALALGLRILFLCEYKNTGIFPILPYSDSYYYYLWGRDIAGGDLLGAHVFMKWPLYAYLLGFMFFLSNNNLLSIYLLQFFLGAASCVLVYLIARKLFNRSVAFISALFCSLYGFFVFYDGLLMYTSLSLFLNLLLFLVLLSLDKESNALGFFWSGILLGVCALAQANILLFGILAAIWVLKNNKANFKTYGLYFFLGLAIIIGAVTARNYYVEKDFVPVAGNLGLIFYLGNNPQADGKFTCPENIVSNQEDMFRDFRIIAEQQKGRALKASEVSGYWFNKGLAFIITEPAKYVKLLIRKMVILFGYAEPVHDMEYNFIKNKIRVFKFMFMDLRLVLPLAFLGMVTGLKAWKKTALLYIALVTLSAGMLVFFISSRYRLSIVPFLAIFAGLGSYNIFTSARLKNIKGLAGQCVLLAVFFLMILGTGKYEQNLELKSAGELAFNTHFINALLFENSRIYSKAINELNLAEKIRPGSPKPVMRQAVIYFQMKDFNKSEEEFKKTISLCPHCVDAYYNLGFIYNSQGKFEQAKVLLLKAVSLNPQDASNHFQLGITYRGLGQYRLATDEFKSSLKFIRKWRKEDKEAIENELRSLKQ